MVICNAILNFNFHIVWGYPPSETPPKCNPQNYFFEQLPVCFDMNRYLTYKYFDIVWRSLPSPPGTPEMGPRKITFLNGLTWVASFFLISVVSRCSRNKYFDVVWVNHLAGNLLNGPCNVNFLNGLR